ncbi:MAG TPA: hypothetical protein VGL99_33830 [Chloroflexota bacterium]
MRTLNSYDPLQQHALTRFGRLKMLQRDVLPKLDKSDFRTRLTLKALYSTYQDLQELGLEEEARLMLVDLSLTGDGDGDTAEGESPN